MLIRWYIVWLVGITDIHRVCMHTWRWDATPKLNSEFGQHGFCCLHGTLRTSNFPCELRAVDAYWARPYLELFWWTYQSMLSVDVMRYDCVFSVTLIDQQLQFTDTLTIGWHVTSWVKLDPGTFPAEKVEFVNATQLGEFKQLFIVRELCYKNLSPIV